MSDSTVLNVKISKELKKRAQATAKALGLPISTVVVANLREFVSIRSITISDEPRLKPEVVNELLELSKNAKEGRDLSPAFGSADEAVAWLEKEIN